MNPNDYLKKILEQQTFDDDDQELKDLRDRRDAIKTKLESHFAKSKPSIRWAGSMAKGTMICESYDGDATCYFAHEETEAGTTLEELYNAVWTALQGDYLLEQKPSAIRISDKSTNNYAVYLHIDIVPGRYTDDTKSDVFLHRTTGDKERLKTNLQVHIDHVRDSGVVDAIRLGKLWNCRNGIQAKTFVLELLIIKVLKDKKGKPLSDQLTHLWTEFRDHSDTLSVEDPANPEGNDLKPSLDQVRSTLSSVARSTLTLIESSGWEAVFGEIESDDDPEENGGESKKAALKSAAAAVVKPSKPWRR